MPCNCRLYRTLVCMLLRMNGGSRDILDMSMYRLLALSLEACQNWDLETRIRENYLSDFVPAHFLFIS